MLKVVSGTRPTGSVHLGNYLGAIVNYVKMQEAGHENYFFIADYHALTTHPDPKELAPNVYRTLATYLAAGLDPNKCHIYLQSDLPQIPELYLLLNMFAYKGELEKVPTFKEKVRAKGQTVNAGLLTYPVLMAADIIIHRATHVPVGKDQEQHLEMTRNFAKRFNHVVNAEFFPEPVAYNFDQALLKVPSLDGSGKMSKSNTNPNSAIYLTDSDDVIIKKMKKAKTSTTPEEKNEAIPEEIANLFLLMDLVSDKNVKEQFIAAWNDCNIRFGDLKMQIAEDLVKMVKPLREKIEAFSVDKKMLKEVTNEGGKHARKNANETLKGVRELLGFNYF